MPNAYAMNLFAPFNFHVVGWGMGPRGTGACDLIDNIYSNE